MKESKPIIEVEDSRTIFDRLMDTLREYIDLKARLLKLSAYEKTAKLITYLLAAFLLIGFFLVCYILINIALGFIIADALDSMSWGFAIVGLGNISIAVLIFVFKRQLILNPMINFTVKKIMKNETNEWGGTKTEGDQQS